MINELLILLGFKKEEESFDIEVKRFESIKIGKKLQRNEAIVKVFSKENIPVDKIIEKVAVENGVCPSIYGQFNEHSVSSDKDEEYHVFWSSKVCRQ